MRATHAQSAAATAHAHSAAAHMHCAAAKMSSATPTAEMRATAAATPEVSATAAATPEVSATATANMSPTTTAAETAAASCVSSRHQTKGNGYCGRACRDFPHDMTSSSGPNAQVNAKPSGPFRRHAAMHTLALRAYMNMCAIHQPR
jgi:hypothetical protein